MKETAALAERCTQLQYEQLTVTSVQKAKECVLDYLGCAWAGYGFESSRIVREFATKNYAKGRCTVIGRGADLNATGASFVNSSAGHAPELDDLHKEGGLHIGVVVIPVVLALAEEYHLNGRDFLTATVLGYDVAAKVGRAASPKVQLSKGFHPTATCGVFGAAAAASRLMNFEAEKTAYALGIAGSFASGSLECYSDGTLTKRINPAIAASSGIMAASLASSGYTGPKSILEGPRGFLRAYSGEDCRIEELTQFDRFEIEGISLKSHACCGFNQAPIDAMLKIRSEQKIAPEDVASVLIELSELGYFTVGQPKELKLNPKNEVDAQFSAPFGVAVACIAGKALLEEYSPEVLRRPDVARFMQKISVMHATDLDALGPDALPARVTVVTNDGSKFTEEVWQPKGDALNPLSWQEVVGKFRSLVPRSMATEERVDRIVHTVSELERVVDVVELSRLQAGETR